MNKKSNTDKAIKALAAVDPDKDNLELIREAAEALRACLDGMDFSAEQSAEAVLRKMEERGLIPKKPGA